MAKDVQQSAGAAGMVHWHEGLFLQPHHLQATQRDYCERIWRERRLGWAYPYGVIDAKLSIDALENMLVRFDRLRAVMPSGVEVDFPESAELPGLDIKRVFATSSGSFTVSLGVPMYQPARANTVEQGNTDGARVKRIFKVAEGERADENTGENRQPMLLRRVNARLVVDGDDVADMEVLPLVRIVHATGEDLGRPQQDKTFVPPCLLLSGSGVLRPLVRDLGNQLETVRREAVIETTRGGFSIENLRGIQIEQLMRLRILNAYAARLPAIAMASGVTPFEAYLEMRTLLAELASLAPDRDPWEAPKYDHDNPAVCFFEVDRRVRQLLARSAVPKFIKINFEREGAILAAAMEDKHVTAPTEYFLGVKSKGDPMALAKLVESADKFKLMPRSMERLMILGVRLAEERHPPYELPAQPGLSYFRLLRTESKTMWERIVQEKKMAIRWPESEPFDYSEVALYMTVPEGQA